ncbi:transposase domain-containing protein [Pseudomonas petrae]
MNIWRQPELKHAYLNDVLRRLPTQRANEINQLLPHQRMAA